MWPMILWFVLVALVATCIAWLADHPGTVDIVWFGYQIQMPILAALFILLGGFAALMLAWGVVKRLLFAPAAVTGFLGHRKRRKGHLALSRGIIAIGAGDLDTARKQAQIAMKSLPKEPLVKLLEAQTAQLEGDNRKVKQVFESMLNDSETEALGLRGLFNQARQAGNYEEAGRLAARAMQVRPSLPWASSAMLAVHSSARDWRAVIGLIETQKRAGVMSAQEANRKRAVAETAEAAALEQSNEDEALRLALKAHKDAPELVPPVLIAARLLAGRGSVRKAMRIIEQTWDRNPHRDLVDAYAHVRPGDSGADRLKRVRALVARGAPNEEGAIGLARVAIDSHDFATAREALKPYIDGRPHAGICLLMAQIERLEHGDTGKEREWLARAVVAPQDAAWTADGFVSDVWQPVSPVTGELDAFEWRRPVEGITHAGKSLEAEELKQAALLEAKLRPADAPASSGGEDAPSASQTSDVPSVVVAAVPTSAATIVPPPVTIPYPDAAATEPEQAATTTPMAFLPDDPGIAPESTEKNPQQGWLNGPSGR